MSRFDSKLHRLLIEVYGDRGKSASESISLHPTWLCPGAQIDACSDWADAMGGQLADSLRNRRRSCIDFGKVSPVSTSIVMGTFSRCSSRRLAVTITLINPRSRLVLRARTGRRRGCDAVRVRYSNFSPCPKIWARPCWRSARRSLARFLVLHDLGYIDSCRPVWLAKALSACASAARESPRQAHRLLEPEHSGARR